MTSRDRASFVAALERAVDPTSRPALLVLFALEGLDEYLALFGEAKTERLLARLAVQIAETLPESARLYEPRADEFAALIPTPVSELQLVLTRALASLRDDCGPVAVRAAYGAAMLPDEASTPVEALSLADQRLASNAPRRRRRRRSSGSSGRG